MRTIRTPYVGGNWKMNTDRASAAALAGAVARGAAEVGGTGCAGRCEVAIFPPFPYLIACAEALRAVGAAGGGVILGGQDVYHAEKGAFTGEVSPLMLRDCGATSVLCGHSERRHVLHEGDDMVSAKVRASLAAGLAVVLCVGEKLEQRVTGQTDTVNERQVRLGLREVAPENLARIVIAYEPVWAIGTGKVASPDDAQDAHAKIRAVVADIYSDQHAAALRVIYGGSVTAQNATGLFVMPDIDGGLIGGASLKADEFGQIVRAAASRRQG